MSLSGLLRHSASRNVGAFCRQLSGAVTKEKIVTLRHQTGLGLDKCRSALIAKEGNVEEAAAFLKEEAKKYGWAKMEKLSGRQSTQGLLGVIHSDDSQSVSIVEVSCETDFVGRCEPFVELVHSTARTFHKHSRSLLPVGQSVAVGQFDFERMRDMQVDGGSVSLADHLAEFVGVIGENIVIRRGTSITSPLLSSYAHSVSVPARDDCQFSHICTVADLHLLSAETAYSADQKQAARRLCQHLLSMQPEDPGHAMAARPYNLDSVRAAHKDLLAEKFVLDESKTVAEHLEENGLAMGAFFRTQLGQE